MQRRSMRLAAQSRSAVVTAKFGCECSEIGCKHGACLGCRPLAGCRPCLFGSARGPLLLLLSLAGALCPALGGPRLHCGQAFRLHLSLRFFGLCEPPRLHPKSLQSGCWVQGVRYGKAHTARVVAMSIQLGRLHSPDSNARCWPISHDRMALPKTVYHSTAATPSARVVRGSLHCLPWHWLQPRWPSSWPSSPACAAPLGSLQVPSRSAPYPLHMRQKLHKPSSVHCLMLMASTPTVPHGSHLE